MNKNVNWAKEFGNVVIELYCNGSSDDAHYADYKWKTWYGNWDLSFVLERCIANPTLPASWRI